MCLCVTHYFPSINLFIIISLLYLFCSQDDDSKVEAKGQKVKRGKKKGEEKTSLTLSDFCGFCRGTRERNRYDEEEDLLTCSECGNSGEFSSIFTGFALLYRLCKNSLLSEC